MNDEQHPRMPINAGPAKRLRWNLAGVALGCLLPPLLFKMVQPGRLHLDFLYAAASGLLMVRRVCGVLLCSFISFCDASLCSCAGRGWSD